MAHDGAANRPSGCIIRIKDGQYTSENFQRLAAEGITSNLSGRSNCRENSAVESFFASLKKDRLRLNTYLTRDATRAEVFDCIEASTSTGRRNSTLGEISPAEFERTQAGLA